MCFRLVAASAEELRTASQFNVTASRGGNSGSCGKAVQIKIPVVATILQRTAPDTGEMIFEILPPDEDHPAQHTQKTNTKAAVTTKVSRKAAKKLANEKISNKNESSDAAVNMARRLTATLSNIGSNIIGFDADDILESGSGVNLDCGALGFRLANTDVNKLTLVSDNHNNNTYTTSNSLSTVSSNNCSTNSNNTTTSVRTVIDGNLVTNYNSDSNFNIFSRLLNNTCTSASNTGMLSNVRASINTISSPSKRHHRQQQQQPSSSIVKMSTATLLSCLRPISPPMSVPGGSRGSSDALSSYQLTVTSSGTDHLPGGNDLPSEVLSLDSDIISE